MRKKVFIVSCQLLLSSSCVMCIPLTAIANDAARVAGGDLKVDGIHFSTDGSVQTKASPWGNGDPSASGNIGFVQGNVGIGTLAPSEQLEITGNLKLPPTTTSAGHIRQGSYTLLHSFGTANIFLGTNAGNTSMSGTSNTAVGYWALNRNTSGNHNVAVGSGSLFYNTSGYNNTANGANALGGNSTGNYNTAIGASALGANTSNGACTAVGAGALASQSYNSGTFNANTAVGFRALYSNNPTTSLNGSGNTAVGSEALQANTTGSYNAATGYTALTTNTTGDNNSAHGYYTLHDNTTGSANAAMGYAALTNNTEGSYNTAIGYFAGASTVTGGNANTTGYHNTFIGAYSNIGTSTQLTNATAIGYKALVSQSNSLALGGTGADAVKVGIGTASPTETLDLLGTMRLNDNDIYFRNGTDRLHGIGFYGGSKTFAGIDLNGPALYGNGGGVLGTNNGTQKIILKWGSDTLDFYGYSRFRVLSSGSTSACLDANNSISTCSSDARLKKDVVPLVDSMDVLGALPKLRGVSFTWDTANPKSANSGGGRDIGMIAQEVEQVFPEIVHTDRDGYKSMDYPKLSAYLIEVVKAQQLRLDALNRRLTELESRR